MPDRREFHTAALATTLGAFAVSAAEAKKVTKYCRFKAGDIVAYGIVEGDTIHQLDGDLFGTWKKSGKTHSLSSVKFLAPTQPTQVLAMAGNYKSHLPDQTIPEKFKIPQVFFKTPSCLIGDGEKIILPDGSTDVHFEAEMVLVIGKRAVNVSKDKALDYVLGVTCGNDVSARDWQKNDVQWWRAKGHDTFGPCGPFIVAGVDPGNIMLRMKINGEVKQEQSTKDLIHDTATMVSFISHHVTLNPGDLIYTGTPAKTSAMKPGDIAEVELEGVCLLRNPVTAAGKA